MIYEAQLVEKPNGQLASWIKALVVVHGCFTLYTAYSYKLHHADDLRWSILGATWLLFGILIPLMGLRASENVDKSRLALFSGIQGFVGFFNLVNFLSFSSVLTTVMSWCSSDDCQEQFVSRNHSCLVSVANETYEMSERYCIETPYNIGTAMFFALLSFVSCRGAMAARQMNAVKVVSIVSVDHVPVSRRCTVPVPEDVEFSAVQSLDVSVEDETEVTEVIE